MYLKYPFTIAHGRVATASADEHVVQLVEQVLLTSPGERVNLPSFGAGVEMLVFEPDSTELAAATRRTVEGTLQMTLSDLIHLEAVEVRALDQELEITVVYLDRATQKQRRVTLAR